jgi:pimeloyl-ACP methyl ester carboxylesterase
MDDPAATTRAIQAIVHTARSETVYRRAGTGLPVLLLAERNGGEDADAVFAALAAGYRVVAPVAAAVPDGVRCGAGAGVVDAVAWLRDLIDGLGLDRPIVVADAAFAGHATELALVDPHRVRRLVLLSGDDAADPSDLMIRLRGG